MTNILQLGLPTIVGDKKSTLADNGVPFYYGGLTRIPITNLTSTPNLSIVIQNVYVNDVVCGRVTNATTGSEYFHLDSSTDGPVSNYTAMYAPNSGSFGNICYACVSCADVNIEDLILAPYETNYESMRFALFYPSVSGTLTIEYDVTTMEEVTDFELATTYSEYSSLPVQDRATSRFGFAKSSINKFYVETDMNNRVRESCTVDLNLFEPFPVSLVQTASTSIDVPMQTNLTSVQPIPALQNTFDAGTYEIGYDIMGYISNAGLNGEGFITVGLFNGAALLSGSVRTCVYTDTSNSVNDIENTASCSFTGIYTFTESTTVKIGVAINSTNISDAIILASSSIRWKQVA